MITQARLKELLNYDAETGLFTWVLTVNRHVKAGDVASCQHNAGYIRIGVENKRYLAHRLAWLYIYGEMPDLNIDHINGIRTDNKISNLRVGSQAKNIQNQRKARTDNKVGFLGVSWHKKDKAYRARIQIDGKGIWLGNFKTAELAHGAYVAAKRNLHPFNTI